MDRAPASQVTDRLWAVSTQREGARARLRSSGKPRVLLSSLPAALALFVRQRSRGNPGGTFALSPGALSLHHSHLFSPLLCHPHLVSLSRGHAASPTARAPARIPSALCCAGFLLLLGDVSDNVSAVSSGVSSSAAPQKSGGSEICGFREERAASQATQEKTFWRDFKIGFDEGCSRT